jgi:uncharacterized cupin superfamily protein
VNLFAFDEWEWTRERPGWEMSACELGGRLGSELITASIYELPPGGKNFPYHFHYGEEELLIVLAGRPTLRTPDGERELRRGDCVAFPLGPRGAHLLRNDSDAPARFVLFASTSDPEVAVYPDSEKLGVWGGFDQEPEGQLDLFVRRDSAVPYWEGESDWVPPRE